MSRRLVYIIFDVWQQCQHKSAVLILQFKTINVNDQIDDSFYASSFHVSDNMLLHLFSIFVVCVIILSLTSLLMPEMTSHKHSVRSIQDAVRDMNIGETFHVCILHCFHSKDPTS